MGTPGLIQVAAAPGGGAPGFSSSHDRMAATIVGHESSRTGYVGICRENPGTRGYWNHLLSRDHRDAREVSRRLGALALTQCRDTAHELLDR